jgi:hypothetical protein
MSQYDAFKCTYTGYYKSIFLFSENIQFNVMEFFVIIIKITFLKSLENYFVKTHIYIEESNCYTVSVVVFNRSLFFYRKIHRMDHQAKKQISEIK